MSADVIAGLAPAAQTPRSTEFEADLVRLCEAVGTMQDSMTSPTSRLDMWLEPKVLGFRWQQVHTVRQTLIYGDLSFMPGFLARVGRAEHRLFWLSPLDSEPVRRTLQTSGSAVGVVGLAVTLYIVLSALAVGLDSPLVLPVVATFTAVGYLAVGTALVSIRRNVRALTRGVRDRYLAVLQDRIEGYDHRLGALAPAENDELRHLVETYRPVRDAPTKPSAPESFGQAARALLIPTLGFFLAVLSGVYAERLHDQLLP